MPQATRDLDIPRREGYLRAFPVKAGTRLFTGVIVCLDSTGFAVRGSVSTTLTAVGRCEGQADNTSGADGSISVTVGQGCFRYANSTAGDLLTNADVDKPCFVVDDNTVAKTNGTSTRSVAGMVRAIEPNGVWVELGQAR